MFGQETRTLINSMFIACSQITNYKLLWYLGGWKNIKKQIAHKSPDRLLDCLKKILPPPPRYETSCLPNCLFTVPRILLVTTHSASQSCLARPCLLQQRVTTPPSLIRLKFCKNLVPLTDLGKTLAGRHKRDCLGNTSTKGSKIAHLHNRYIY